MAWSIFVNEFIQEIVRTKGVAAESVRAEFQAAAHRAAVRELGDRTPIEVELTNDIGDVHFFQVVCAVEAPSDPKCEIPLFALRRAAPDYADTLSGDELRVQIFYTANPQEREVVGKLEAELGPLLPLPIHSSELWERLTEELNALVLRYFPAPSFPAGSLGDLLATGGGWTRGLSAKSGDIEIILERAFLDFIRLRVTGGWFEYGFITAFKKGGEEIFRGGPGYSSGRIGEQYLEPLAKGDNDGIVRSWGDLPASPELVPELVDLLQRIADDVAGGGSTNRTMVNSLLTAAIRRPRRGGLWEWMERSLPALLVGHAREIDHQGTRVRFEISEAYPPDVGLTYFGTSAIRIVSTSSDPDLVPYPEGEPIQAGRVGPEALALRGPETPEEEEALKKIVAVFCEWLDAHLAHHVATRGIDGIEFFHYFYAFDGYFPLAQLLEQRIKWGDPGEPPVPRFDEETLERAGRSLKPVLGDERRSRAIEALSTKQEHVFALFSIQGWTIGLLDELSGRPFGSYCGIELLPPDGGRSVNVMMVDAWNPPARTVVDGDAFAFRRFIGWLREAIIRGGYDRTVAYHSDTDEEEHEDEGDDVDREPIEISISDWLLFGMPDCGDRFLVDWRAQWHVVNADDGTEGFTGIYGFTGAYVEKLRTYDIPVWRRFLREVIDPRFKLDNR